MSKLASAPKATLKTHQKQLCLAVKSMPRAGMQNYVKGTLEVSASLI